MAAERLENGPHRFRQRLCRHALTAGMFQTPRKHSAALVRLVSAMSNGLRAQAREGLIVEIRDDQSARRAASPDPYRSGAGLAT
jgi:hypothetical protein